MQRAILGLGLCLLGGVAAAAQPPSDVTMYELAGVLHVKGEPDVPFQAGGTLPRKEAFGIIRHGLLDPNVDHAPLTHGLELSWFVVPDGDGVNLEVHARVESRTEAEGAPKTSESRTRINNFTYTRHLPLSGENVTLFTSKDSHYELFLKRFGPEPK